jgi:hypothetical protein
MYVGMRASVYLFIYLCIYLFIDAVNSSENIASDERMVNE